MTLLMGRLCGFESRDSVNYFRWLTKAGLAMYAMELEGDMLESFVGEFGNSVAGHTAAKLYNEGVAIDSTPPTTMMGQVKLGGFSKAIHVPFLIENEHEGHLVIQLGEVT